MKNFYFKTALFLMAMFLPGIVLSQPSLSWRLGDPEIEGENLLFSVYIKATGGTVDFQSGQVVMYYNETAFPNFEIVDEDTPDAEEDDYTIIPAGLTKENYSISSSINTYELGKGLYIAPSYSSGGRFELEDNKWNIFVKVRVPIEDKTEPAGFVFIGDNMQGSNSYGSDATQFDEPYDFKEDFSKLNLGRIFSTAGGGWTQYGGAEDWSIAENTSIWDGSATIEASDAKMNNLHIHSYFDSEVGEDVLAGLYVAPDAGLTVEGDIEQDPLFGKSSQNAKAEKDGPVTIAEWNFEDAAKRANFPGVNGYTADDGGQQDETTISVDVIGAGAGGIDPTYLEEPDNNYTAAAGGWGDNLSNWSIEFSASGLNNLKISSKQLSANGGPTGFTVQYSTDGTTWVDITNGNYTMTIDDWYELTDLDISVLDDEESAYIRWLNTGGFSSGTSYIDDIIITGEEIPTYNGIVIGADEETGASGSFIHSTDDIPATVEHYPAGGNAWQMISGPVDMDILGSDFAPGESDDFYMYYDQDPGIWVNFKNRFVKDIDIAFNDNDANGGTEFVPGRGYLVSYDVGENKEFSGDLNANAVPFALDVNDPESDKSGAAKSWTYEPGWNLIGNPYASYIDWDAVVAGNPGLLAENHAQVYDHNEGGGGDYVHPTTLKPKQGFFVLAENAGNLTFENTHQVHAPVGKSHKVAAQDMLRLNIAHEDYYSQTSVFLNPEASEDHDRYDASKMFSFNPDMPQIYSSTADGRMVAINSLPEIHEELVIPVGVRLPSEGEYTISLSEELGAFSSSPVYLVDHEAEKEVLLSEAGLYTFNVQNATEDSGANRFELRFGDAPTDTDIPEEETGMKAWAVDHALYLETSHPQTEVTVYDIQGRQMKQHRMDAGSEQLQLNTAPGMYFVQMVSGNKVKTTKVVIR
ncbi:MAG: T9SS type A sorting domain-containing protein [Bacteroidales bacterium]